MRLKMIVASANTKRTDDLMRVVSRPTTDGNLSERQCTGLKSTPPYGAEASNTAIAFFSLGQH